jgi:hypothetical protein
MAAYTNAQLNSLYTYFGFGTYITVEPEVVSAIKETQALVDGGGQPDDSTQLAILAVVANLQSIDAQLVNISQLFFAQESSAGSKINPARADFMLRKQGRALIKQIVIMCNMRGVRQDYYSKAPVRGGSSRMSYTSYMDQ